MSAPSSEPHFCKHCHVEIRPAGGGAWMDVETVRMCDDDSGRYHVPDGLPEVEIKDFPFAGTHCATPATCPVCTPSSGEEIVKADETLARKHFHQHREDERVKKGKA